MEIVFYRVEEFLEKYVLSKSSFYREVRAGRLCAVKRGRTTLITKQEAERWQASLKKTPYFDASKFQQAIEASMAAGRIPAHR